MRGTVHNLYVMTLRTLALVGLVCVAWLMSRMPTMIAESQFVGTPFSVGVIAAVISLALLWSYLTPSWIGRPVRPLQIVPLTLAFLMLPVIYGFVGMSAILSTNLEPSLANQIALGLGGFLLFGSIAGLVLGIRLCFWERKPRPIAEDTVTAFHREIEDAALPNRRAA